MKNILATRGRSLALAGALALLAGLMAYVAMRAGPLAPVPVTVVTVESRSITPALFGIGTVEARYTHKIGPTFAGRIERVNVQPGDGVKRGQLLAEIDPIDLDDKVRAQEAALSRGDAGIAAAKAQIQEAAARENYAEAQSRRYDELLSDHTVSAEAAEAKRQELQVAQASLLAARANLNASRQERARLGADYEGLVRQRANLHLVSPVDGLVTRRDVDAGTTVVAGQTVVEVVEPGSVWINVRIDQQRALGLQAELPALILLRSQSVTPLSGRVSRIEPHADPVTEETLAKVEFSQRPAVLPPIGELAEVTIALAAQKSMPVVPNASVHRVEGRLGVWVVEQGSLRFAPVKMGATDLDGQVQIVEGLSGGERVVVYSQKSLGASSRIKIVERIPGTSS